MIQLLKCRQSDKWDILNLIYKAASTLNPKLFKVLEAIKPERFYLYNTMDFTWTNLWQKD